MTRLCVYYEVAPVCDGSVLSTDVVAHLSETLAVKLYVDVPCVVSVVSGIVFGEIAPAGDCLRDDAYGV